MLDPGLGRSGRPYHLSQLAAPLLASVLGREQLPCPQTLYRSLAYFSAKDVRTALEAAYLAELPHRSGRVWAAIEAHQIPYWGRGQRDHFQKGWSGSHSRRLRGYRLDLAVDTETGQLITFVLARGRKRDAQLGAVLTRHLRQLLGRQLAGVVADCGCISRAAVQALLASGVPCILGFARSKPIKQRLAVRTPQQRRWLTDGGAIRFGPCPWDERLRLFALGARSSTDQRGPWVYVTSLRFLGPNQLTQRFRQRWRGEQASEELLNGHDLDHLASYRVHPNQIAIGFRLLSRTWPSTGRLTRRRREPRSSRSPGPFAPTTLTAWASMSAGRIRSWYTPSRVRPWRFGCPGPDSSPSSPPDQTVESTLARVTNLPKTRVQMRKPRDDRRDGSVVRSRTSVQVHNRLNVGRDPAASGERLRRGDPDAGGRTNSQRACRGRSW